LGSSLSLASWLGRATGPVTTSLKVPMDAKRDEQQPPQLVEIVENACLDEFDEEETGAPPAPPVAAAVGSDRTGDAARESLEPTIIASEVVALKVEGA